MINLLAVAVTLNSQEAQNEDIKKSVHGVRPSVISLSVNLKAQFWIFGPDNYLNMLKWCPRHAATSLLPSKNP